MNADVNPRISSLSLPTMTNDLWCDSPRRGERASLSAFCDGKMGRGSGRGASFSYFAFKHRVQLKSDKPRTVFRCAPHAYASTNRGAFTLIELAVVLGAIGVITAMMLPALAGTKTNGKSFQCLNNLKQLAQAWTMYADESSERVVNLNTYARDSSGNTVPIASAQQGVPWRTQISMLTVSLPTGVASGTKAAQIYLTEMGYQRPAPGVDGPLFRFYKNPDAMHCPADFRANLPAGSLYSGPYGWDSYSGSSFLNGEQWTDSRAILKRPAVTRPSGKFIWTEGADMRGENLGSWQMNAVGTAALNFTDARFLDSPAAFHSSAAAFNFCDGHAEIHRWQNTATIAFANDTSASKSAPGAGNVDAAWCGAHYAGTQNP